MPTPDHTLVAAASATMAVPTAAPRTPLSLTVDARQER